MKQSDFMSVLKCSPHLSQRYSLSLFVWPPLPQPFHLLPTFLLPFSSFPPLRERLEAASWITSHGSTTNFKKFKALRNISFGWQKYHQHQQYLHQRRHRVAVSNHSCCIRIYKLPPVCNFHSIPVYLSFQFIGTFPFSVPCALFSLSLSLFTSQLLWSINFYLFFPPALRPFYKPISTSFSSLFIFFYPLILVSLCGCKDGVEQITS